MDLRPTVTRPDRPEHSDWPEQPIGMHLLQQPPRSRMVDLAGTGVHG